MNLVDKQICQGLSSTNQKIYALKKMEEKVSTSHRKNKKTTTLQFNSESVLFVGRNNNLQVLGVVFSYHARNPNKSQISEASVVIF